ncbi:hypothetical protein ELI20_01225 [Rhizobium ruizarguesonis]|uniref:hypothetical protein n=1 Tax=Rhizobium ruizarguesonis TaxID=2081791 RepID=UPI001030BF47|nr:hypothetical protein [Rhizobium ruizarguesonis]TAU29790.1 hypothetical protein ELI47_01110 [Rhizobium ruizarguesonis]TAW19938.1 hypothetical protein ELI20_01225 [Rhizobium ruizarguesonis]
MANIAADETTLTMNIEMLLRRLQALPESHVVQRSTLLRYLDDMQDRLYEIRHWTTRDGQSPNPHALGAAWRYDPTNEPDDNDDI